MKYVWPIFRREFAAYFATPLAYVFIVIFLFAMGAFTFYIGNFYSNGIADLSVFFGYHPWLYLFLVPAISMRLWAEERRTGTMELLLTLPIPLWATVLGKFLAAWAFIGIALVLTFPIWLTVNYLGAPDNGREPPIDYGVRRVQRRIVPQSAVPVPLYSAGVVAPLG